jgi:hypothetical protein
VNDPFDDHANAWHETAKALIDAFFYDNLLPIYEIIKQFDSAFRDLRHVQALCHKARIKPLSLKEQTRFDKLLRKKPQAGLEQLIETLNNFRTLYHHEDQPVNNVIKNLRSSRLLCEKTREQSAAKDKALADVETLCKSLLEEFKSDCPDHDSIAKK